MPDLTPERLAELRALAAEATPGPWFDAYSGIFSAPLTQIHDDLDYPECEIPKHKAACGVGPCPGCPHFEHEYEHGPIVAHVPAHHGDTPTGRHVADAHWIAAVSPDVVTALLDEIERLRDDYDDAMADLAGLVEVAAGAVSDETALDPGVEVLMRYLAANYPAAGADGVLAVEVTADASRYVETMGKLEALARQRVQREAVAIDMAVELPGIEPDKVPDLMAALEDSVARAKAAQQRHPQPKTKEKS